MKHLKGFGHQIMLSLFLATAALPASSDPVGDQVRKIQLGWERATYQVPLHDQSRLLEDLADEARQASKTHAGKAEVLVWEGIVLSSLAGAKGGLGALGIAKRARARLEEALRIDDQALEGSAYNSLGVLYYKVPGWPIGFGDKHKAEWMLRQALAINPDGIDPNYFYGDFLVSSGRPSEALPYLERALAAKARPGREIADAGRRAEVAALLEKARSQL